MTHALSIWASGHDPGARLVDLPAPGEAADVPAAAVAASPPGTPGGAAAGTGERP